MARAGGACDGADAVGRGQPEKVCWCAPPARSPSARRRARSPPAAKQDELEKRFGAEFAQAQPAVFLDNANGLALRSDTLASVLTERPAGVRVLGETRMVQLNSTAFVAITGNGLTLIEDLARRFHRLRAGRALRRSRNAILSQGIFGRDRTAAGRTPRGGADHLAVGPPERLHGRER